MKQYLKSIIDFILIFLFWILAVLGKAQTYQNPVEIEALEATILAKDSLFWIAYNTCDLGVFPDFLTEDLEFYHDQGGLTSTNENLIAGMRDGLCQTGKNSLYREVVAGTVAVFPLNHYGAIITGEHTFAPVLDGVVQAKEGVAKFTHVWQLAEGQWKMSRVLSYDHQAYLKN